MSNVPMRDGFGEYGTCRKYGNIFLSSPLLNAFFHEYGMSSTFHI